MITLRRIYATFGLSLAVMFGISAGCASPDEPGESSEEGSIGEAAEAIEPPPWVPPGSLLCTVSSGFTSTGREWAHVYIAQPGVCCRKRIGGEAPMSFSRCHQRAREELSCGVVVDC